MSAELARGTPVSMTYRSAERDGHFYARTAFIRTRKVRLVAAVSSAITVDARGAVKGILLVPLHGAAHTRRGERTFEWGAGQNALYLPAGGCSTRSTARSVVGIDIDPADLCGVTQVMLGGRVPQRSFDFAIPSVLYLRGHNIDFGRVIEGLASAMGLLGGDEHLIEKAGLDDAMLRVVALLLNFEALSSDGVDTKPHSAVVRLACEYIDAHLVHAITLTDLETLVGVSRRSLQYAFRATFDCTPMQWVAQRRLEAVRSRILAAEQGATLTSIAGAYFSNLGEFARMYKAKYGELPSVTLKSTIAERRRR